MHMRLRWKYLFFEELSENTILNKLFVDQYKKSWVESEDVCDCAVPYCKLIITLQISCYLSYMCQKPKKICIKHFVY
jgi:hypothetical protein